MRKSQSATEYIIILAVVLVVAGIIISSMSGVTSISSSSDELNSQKFWQTSDIAITAVSFKPDNTASIDATLTIVNNFPTTISIDQINISSNAQDDTNIDLGITPFTLDPGQENTINLSLNSNNPCYNKEPGDKYDIAIVFKYTDEEIEKTYYFRGNSVRLKGSCALQ